MRRRRGRTEGDNLGYLWFWATIGLIVKIGSHEFDGVFFIAAAIFIIGVFVLFSSYNQKN